jgi:thiol:disulfide interchange protein DsbD
MGLFFVLTTYTCGAPLVLGVLATAATTPHPLALVAATAVFGTTIALPFFVLALIPGFLKSLPRGGHWFDAFKTVLGFLEIAFAFKFLRTTDVAFDLGIVTRPVLLGVWILCAGLSFAYLLGWLKLFHEGEEPLERVTLGRFSWALVFAFVGIYLAQGLERKLPGPIEAFMLSSADPVGVEQRGKDVSSPEAEEGYRFGRLHYKKRLERGP